MRNPKIVAPGDPIIIDDNGKFDKGGSLHISRGGQGPAPGYENGFQVDAGAIHRAQVLGDNPTTINSLILSCAVFALDQKTDSERLAVVVAGVGLIATACPRLTNRDKKGQGYDSTDSARLRDFKF